MDIYKYIQVPSSLIPKAIQDHYQLHSLADNGFVYVEIQKGMYGLPHAGKLDNNDLVIHLATNGYIQSPYTPGLFTHTSRPISFCLVVEDFGVKYVGREHAEHLLTTLQSKCRITTDWSGAK
jgi:hypothetical protein